MTVNTTGQRTDGSSASASVQDRFVVYRDWFTDINGSETRHQENVSNGDTVRASGPTYVEVPSALTPTFTDSIGEIPNSELEITTINKTVNSVTREYKRIYLGDYTDPNTFTIGGV